MAVEDEDEAAEEGVEDEAEVDEAEETINPELTPK